MTYLYECDGFHNDEDPEEYRFDSYPALTAEFNEDLYDEGRVGDLLRQAGYEPGDLVTFCPECTLKLLT